MSSVTKFICLALTSSSIHPRGGLFYIFEKHVKKFPILFFLNKKKKKKKNGRAAVVLNSTDDDDNLLIYINPLGVINHIAITMYMQ